MQRSFVEDLSDIGYWIYSLPAVMHVRVSAWSVNLGDYQDSNMEDASPRTDSSTDADTEDKMVLTMQYDGFFTVFQKSICVYDVHILAHSMKY